MVQDVSSEEYQKYRNWTSQNEIGIIANLKCDAKISTSFATYEKRNTLIKELYHQIMQNQYSGICIDFDEIDDVNSFYRFLIELTPKFKESSLKVMVKLNNQIDEQKVKNIVDFII